jgi:hypothetical protein
MFGWVTLSSANVSLQLPLNLATEYTIQKFLRIE